MPIISRGEPLFKVKEKIFRLLKQRFPTLIEVKNKCKTYPDGLKVVTVYHHRFQVQESGWELVKNELKERQLMEFEKLLMKENLEIHMDEDFQELVDQEKENRVFTPEELDELYRWQSINRSKTLVRDYVLANPFSSFITLTFSNEYENEDRPRYVQRYFRYLRDRYGRFQYLVVPEKTKKGMWHYHSLISDIPIKVQNSGHSTRTGKVIYNIPGWKYGFSTLVRIGKKLEDRKRLAAYLTKYISKQFHQREFNEKRFWSSQGLLKPEKTYNIDLAGLDLVEQFSGDFCSIYHIRS